jgi:hypothetical protein
MLSLYKTLGLRPAHWREVALRTMVGVWFVDVFVLIVQLYDFRQVTQTAAHISGDK